VRLSNEEGREERARSVLEILKKYRMLMMQPKHKRILEWRNFKWERASEKKKRIPL